MELNMEELREMVMKHTPEVLRPEYVAGMIYSIRKTTKRLNDLKKSYEDLDRAFMEYARNATRKIHSNNWLKLHGYPMRRGKENGA